MTAVIAAVVVAIVVLPPLGDQSHQLRLRLIKALDTERSIEPSLANFAYAPLRRFRSEDSARHSAELLSVAADLQQAARDKPSAKTLHSWGLALLAMHRFDEAVAALFESSVSAPTAAVLSDLSAAYLARAQELDRPADLPHGLDAVSRALRLEPSLEAGRFNRALALDLLGIKGEARVAWQEFLSSAAGPGWKEDAARRLDSLISPVVLLDRDVQALVDSEHVVTDVELLRLHAASKGDSSELRDIVDTHLLDKWLEVFDKEGEHAAARFASTRLGLAILASQTIGDGEFAEIWSALAAPKISREASRGVRAYRAGRTAFDAARFHEARQMLEVARRERALQDIGGLSLWVELYLAATEYYATRSEDALAAAERIAITARNKQFVLLEARATSLVGLIAHARGELALATTKMSDSLRLFVAARQAKHASNASRQLALIAVQTGDHTQAWAHVTKSLQSLTEDPLSRHSQLLTAAHLCLQSMLLDCAELFFSVARQNAADAERPELVGEVRMQMGSLAALTRRSSEAYLHFREADAAVAEIADPDLRARVTVSLAAAKATALASLAPLDAKEAGDIAAAEISRRGDKLRLAEIQLALGRAARANGHFKEATDRFNAAASLMAAELASVSSVQRLAYDSPSWGVYHELLKITTDEQEILELSESSRQRTLASSAPRPLRLEDVQNALNDDSAIISLVQADDVLLVQCIGRKFARTARLPVSREHAVQLVHRSRDALRLRHHIGGAAAALEVRSLLEHALGTSLESIPTIFIVPDGPWVRMPFAAIPTDDGAFLVEHISLETWLSVFQLVSREPLRSQGESTVTILVAPPWRDARNRLPALTGARREADGIGAAYRSARRLEGAEATPEALLNALTTSDVVHVAAHGIASESLPLESRLVLAASSLHPDGALTAREVAAGPRVRARLVVLAACDTVNGAYRRDAGPIGVVHSFLFAGAGGVVGSLWELPDEDGADFFVRFHSGLATGVPPSKALRAVQQEWIRRGRPTATWAGVTLFGSE